MKHFVAFALMLALPNLAIAAADEAVIREMVKRTTLTPDEIREHYDGCDSGVTLYMKICAIYSWTKEDIRLNDIYAQTRAKAKELGYEASLVRGQQTWLAYRDMACAHEGDIGAGQGTYYGLYLMGCKLDLTKERADRLEARLDQYDR